MAAVNTSVKNIIALERDSRHIALAVDKIKRASILINGSLLLETSPELVDIATSAQAKLAEHLAIVEAKQFATITALEAATKAVNLL